MSSWANRGIPCRRNLLQIPEGLRPTIITRAQRPEVIQSESFQENEKQNEIIYPSGSEDSSPTPDMNAYSRSYPVRKMELNPAPNAIELRFSDKSYVFVILRNIRTTHDNDLWMASYQSVRRFYTNKIIIIDDNSDINTVNGKLVNTEVIRSDYNGAGEVLPYYYFFVNKWADRMVFLHDSMFLHRRFTDAELNGAVRFHWHFSNTEIRNDRKIGTYLSMLPNHEGLLEYANQPDSAWNGCFGGTSIIDLDIVTQLEEAYSFFSTLVLSIKTRKDRETFERLFGIALYFTKMIDEPFSNFGNIVKYPGAFESQISTPDQGAYALSQKGYDTAIIKVWRGR
jgi:hypothetical protein|uniref:Uncharacterized protein n=1 Tax=viral metagenome TaxID=1070528 RepID=A0A6C0BH96_9ZZZZ